MADPARGWIGSSNERPHPPDSPLPLYGAYGDGYRSRRMRTLLASGRRFTLADMRAMQNDVFSCRAFELSRRLAAILAQSGDDDLVWAGERLQRWGCRFGVGSVGAALFGVFWWRWTEDVASVRFAPHLAHSAAAAAGGMAAGLLKGEESGWFPDGADVATRVRAAMASGLDWLTSNL